MSDKPKDRSEYQRHYYEQHKEELSERRKRKYRDDPEYREKVKCASKRYRALQREGRKKTIVDKPRVRKPRKPVVVEVNGSSVLAYTVSTLAIKIGRSVNTVNRWISIGVIPRTPLWSDRGDRLYTDAMILVVKMAVQSRGIVGRDPNVYSEIESGWRDIGIVVGG